MIKIRQILRMHTQGYSKLQIASQTGISRNTLKKYIKAFSDCQLSWEEVNNLSDKHLEDLFVKPEEKPLSERLQNLFELFPVIDKALKRKGVTRYLLWQEYRKKYPDGLGISQFKHYYAQWKSQVNPTMRMEHKAGDKMFVDFAGDRLMLLDETTGCINPVEVFVSVLGASQLTYVEAVMSQQKEDLILACENGMIYYGGVPAAIVPDNLKSAVTKSSKYEPVLNESFADFAEHYGTSILPARSYRPRDKALVENAVRNIYSRIYPKINKRSYTTLQEMNLAIREALEIYNNSSLTGRNYSRRELFEEIEKMTLMPLPALRYEIKKHLYATVAKNGHVGLSVDKHYYSVPYRFIGKKVKLLYTRDGVEIYYNYEKIAAHDRIKSPYQYTTNKEHLASTHRFVSEWTPEKFISWADSIHEDVKLYILKVLDRKQHPEQAYKSCVGILSFAKKIGKERLIKSCQRALGYGVYNYKTIHNIIERELDMQDDPEENDQLKMPSHDNIRGENYFK